MSDLIVDALFEDNYYNVLKNIKEIFRYQKQAKCLTPERVIFYKSVLEIDQMTNQEKLNFYKKYQSKNVKEEFYEEIRAIKNRLYAEFKNKLFSIKEFQKTHSAINVLGVEVYDLRELPYFILIRCLHEKYKKVYQTKRSCYSLISEKKNPCFLGYDSNIYGFSSFDPSKVLHLYESDAYSMVRDFMSSILENSAVNRLMNVEELMDSGPFTNEIQILNEENEEEAIKMLSKR